MGLRVLMLVRDLATGTQTYTESLLKEFEQRGVEVAVAYTGGTPHLPTKMTKLDQAIPSSIGYRSVTQLFRLLFVIRSLKGCMATFNPNVIFAQGLDEVGLTAWFASWVFRRPAVSFVHDMTLEELMLKNPSTPRHLYVASLSRQKITSERLSAILVGSEFMRFFIMRMFGRAAVVTRLGVKDELLGLTASPSDAPFQIIFIGNLTGKKRPDVPIKVIASLQTLNLRLVIVGDGPDRKTLEALCNRLNVAAKVDFKGHISDRELAEQLQKSHVCLVPSMWEGFGLSAIEAMACGVPVIASEAGGLREAIESGKSGFLVPADLDDLWAYYVKQLYDDRTLLRRLSKNAAEVAREYSWKRTADETLKVLREVTQAH